MSSFNFSVSGKASNVWSRQLIASLPPGLICSTALQPNAGKHRSNATKTNHNQILPNCNLGLSPHTSPNTLYAPLKVLRWLFFLTLLVASPGQVGGKTLDRAVATWKHCSE